MNHHLTAVERPPTKLNAERQCSDKKYYHHACETQTETKAPPPHAATKNVQPVPQTTSQCGAAALMVAARLNGKSRCDQREADERSNPGLRALFPRLNFGGDASTKAERRVVSETNSVGSGGRSDGIIRIQRSTYRLQRPTHDPIAGAIAGVQIRRIHRGSNSRILSGAL